MGDPAGGFIWYELMTDDAAAAARFYAAVVGWTFVAPPPGAPLEYWLIGRSDGGSAGGMLALDAEAREKGARPAWVPYLDVADVEAVVAAIVADGGGVLMPKVTMGVGDIAMVTDPTGVPFYVMRPQPPADQPAAVSDVFSPSAAQHVRWNELASPDPAAALAFYGKHFGFTFAETMPMGPLGDYRFIDHHGLRLGGVMPRQPGQPGQPAAWLSYFGVPSALAASRAIVANGGTVIIEAHEVPGNDWVVVARVPQGAAFGVVGPRGD